MSATATAFSLCSHERTREWNRSNQIVSVNPYACDPRRGLYIVHIINSKDFHKTSFSLHCVALNISAALSPRVTQLSYL